MSNSKVLMSAFISLLLLSFSVLPMCSMHLTRTAYFKNEIEQPGEFVPEELAEAEEAFEGDEVELVEMEQSTDDPGTQNILQKLRGIVTTELNDSPAQPIAKARPKQADRKIASVPIECRNSIDIADIVLPKTLKVKRKPAPKVENKMIMNQDDWKLAVLGNYEKAYRQSVQHYYDQNYTRSIHMFRALITRNKKHPLASQCQNWIGENYFAMNELASAIVEFEKLALYPNSSKNDEAQLMVGICLMRIGSQELAQKEFNRLLADDVKRAITITAKKYLAIIDRT